jgi:ribosomal protein S18 acetylase RimI-like enzyme
VFDPQRWLIVGEGRHDIGCLLLADYPRDDQWELVYMGLVREARGRGLGAAIVRHAQWLARQAERSRLVLAVDADNWPAIAVYVACGFVTWDHRSVYVRVF